MTIAWNEMHSTAEADDYNTGTGSLRPTLPRQDLTADPTLDRRTTAGCEEPLTHVSVHLWSV